MILSFSIYYEPHWAELIRMNGLSLGLLGNQEALGNWDESEILLLKSDDFREWSCVIDSEHLFFPLEYKYCLYSTAEQRIVSWEARENRIVDTNRLDKDRAVFVDSELHFDYEMFRGSGVAIPVFSLRSKESFGIGEFLDLKLMVDWALETNQRMIQTLPVNDTSLHLSKADSYPYNTLSVFALNPMYLRLDGMGTLADKRKQAYYYVQREQLNTFAGVEYEHVMNYKWEFFRLIYAQEKAKIQALDNYKDFVEKNSAWLMPYAVFCYLRDAEKTSDFKQWSQLSVYNVDEANKLFAEKADEIGLYIYLQYHLFLQLSEVHAYAQAKGVMLKGDIPIGVSPHSVDVWCNPSLFNLGMQAGAPPDYFSLRGQNWGFPTYNWEAMSKDNYAWWQSRLTYMSYYFDAYRIDHILGFFRIWAVPTDAIWGLLGQFVPAKPFSKEEIKAYGFTFDEDDLLMPEITDEVLSVYFGVEAGSIKSTFLKEYNLEEYTFKTKYNTQQKINAYFKTKPDFSSQDEIIRDKLLHLQCQVLFLKDAVIPDHYHPRISYQDNDMYKKLSKHDKESYMRLYEEFYYHRHNEFWAKQAMSKLPALLSATKMLSCGEDLGMIPSCVPEVMNDLKILSLEIQRMSKTYGHEFGVPFFAPYLSVVTTSTHDMSPIRSWWEEDPIRTQRFFKQMLFEAGESPKICEPWVAEKIIWQHMQSPAMWVVLPLQDWLAIDEDLRLPNQHGERINVPDNPDNYWNYRMHLDLETLLEADFFNHKIRNMVTDCRR